MLACNIAEGCISLLIIYVVEQLEKRNVVHLMLFSMYTSILSVLSYIIL